MITFEAHFALMIVALLCLTGLALVALYYQRKSYDDAFSNFQGLVMPGAIELAKANQEQAKQAEDLLTSLSYEEDGEEIHSSIDELGPLARQYMPGYVFKTPTPPEGEDEVVREMRADVAAYWSQELDGMYDQDQDGSERDSRKEQ